MCALLSSCLGQRITQFFPISQRLDRRIFETMKNAFGVRVYAVLLLAGTKGVMFCMKSIFLRYR